MVLNWNGWPEEENHLEELSSKGNSKMSKDCVWHSVYHLHGVTLSDKYWKSSSICVHSGEYEIRIRAFSGLKHSHSLESCNGFGNRTKSCQLSFICYWIQQFDRKNCSRMDIWPSFDQQTLPIQHWHCHLWAKYFIKTYFSKHILQGNS